MAKPPKSYNKTGTKTRVYTTKKSGTRTYTKGQNGKWTLAGYSNKPPKKRK